MSKIKSLSVLVCLLAAANAWATPFKDDFNRANGAVGNGWTTLAQTGTVTTNIVNNEVLVAGTTGGSAWVRQGIQRTIVGETKVSCDFKNDDTFNFHIQIAAQGSSAYLEAYCWVGGPLQYANSTDGSWPAAGWAGSTSPNAQSVSGQYNNITLEVLPGGKIAVTLNGKLADTITNAGFASTIRQVTIASDADVNTKGSIHIDNVVIGTYVAGKALSPSPADTATDVARDVTLSWTLGDNAKTSNVYLGTTFADANTADATKAVSQGQAGNTYKVATPLQYGQTYYWRVDEVNASNTTFRGDVWSFTVEPYSYPLTNVTATASSALATSPAANTVNGSGLTNGLHGTDPTTMWTTDGKTTPNWIQFQFDNTYTLDKMQVWNSNQMIESLMGFGAKDVTIEYSTDGTTWQTLANAPQFARAPGTVGYAANTTVDFAGAQAKFVKLTINSTWGGMTMTGLSEVRFSYVPVVARLPQPGNNATNVSLGASLDWRPGRDVTSEKVYLGTDKTAVANGTVAPVTLTTHGFTPAALTYGTLYYWKVDEVGAATTYPGPVWSFTTQEWAVVDNFESYNDDNNRIYDSWLDGMGGNGTCSTVGYLPTQAQLDAGAHFAETTIVNSGRQSMPIDCNNVTKPYYSEATRTFDTPLDWTVGGATTLTLSYRGYPAQTVTALNATNAFSLTGDGTDIWGNSDDFTFAYKTLTGDGSIVARVVSVGTGSNTWAKGGVMIRNTTNSTSTFVNMVLTGNSDGKAGNGASFQYRLATAGGCGNTDATALIKAPYWVKLQRAGTALTGYVSANGTTWTQMGTTQNIAMTGPVCLGICVTAHQAGENRTMQFDNIATTGNVAGAWQSTVVNSPRYNVAAPMYLTLEDKAGKKKTVVNPDASAVLKGAWTQWQIALSDLSGINLAAVKKLTIGVGDNSASAQATGDALVYIDDILVGKKAALVNLLTNGGFETGALAPWAISQSAASAVTATVVTDCVGANTPEGPIEGKYCLDLKVSGPGVNFWDSSLHATPLSGLAQGTKYTLSAFFKVKSGTGKVNFKIEHAAGNWEGHGEGQLTVTDKWAEYHVTSEVLATDISPMDVVFHIGFQAQELWVDNIKFYVGDYVPSN